VLVSQWWKCDLQVATPGEPRFHGPVGAWQLKTAEQQAAAADRYMTAAAAAGLQVLVLADHNSVEWVDVMITAGRRQGIVVFPGFEVTSATGSDGAHLILFTGPDRSANDLRPLLYSACGFGPDDPLFNPSRPSEPAPSPRTFPQILDALPEHILALAPHVFGENGLVRNHTVSSQLRWKALHHERLGAVDVGDGARHEQADTWRGKFIRRELSEFPCLPNLPFVSTSDAYDLDQLGSRYTWIRMQAPTLEGMRQAFLDHEARIVCDWDERFRGSSSTPNDITHAYVQQVTLAGLTTTEQPVTVTFDPRLTVLVGGRGAGKSTIVAALRCLYGEKTGLPTQARDEAERLVGAVFVDASVDATHHLAHTGDAQAASWTSTEGSRTLRTAGHLTPTDFKVRVIGQKELFERSSGSTEDPHSTSRNLLALVDDSLAAGAAGPGTAASFDRAHDEARTAWVSAARRHEAEQAAVADRGLVRERVEELTRQVEAFDNEANRSRRARNDRLMAEARELGRRLEDTSRAVAELADDAERRFPEPTAGLATVVPLSPSNYEGADEDQADYVALHQQLNVLRRQARESVVAAAAQALEQLGALDRERDAGRWQRAVNDAVDDSAAYLAELANLGLDPQAYGQVRTQLQEQTTLLTELEVRAQGLSELASEATRAWQAVQNLQTQRRDRRRTLLRQIEDRSGMLRFTISPTSDTSTWVQRVRELLNLRSDGFLEEVPALATWLWTDSEARGTRTVQWRHALITGNFDALTQSASLRSAFARRLQGLDALLRTRLAGETADDVIEMDFLRDGGDRAVDGDWQQLTAGSPGQRSAAMLSFVLHHGSEPLVLDQPEDDLDTEWITQLVVRQLRASRWIRQVVVVTHNANIPVNADAERVVVLENTGRGIAIRQDRDETTGSNVEHCGPLEDSRVRSDIQQILEGGVEAFIRRERRYNNELNTYRAALQQVVVRSDRSRPPAL